MGKIFIENEYSSFKDFREAVEATADMDEEYVTTVTLFGQMVEVGVGKDTISVDAVPCGGNWFGISVYPNGKIEIHDEELKDFILECMKGGN